MILSICGRREEIAMNDEVARSGLKSDTIGEQLRTALLNGEIPPGGRIVLDQWRARLGVSLSPMREALSRLVSVGLVEVDHMRGFRASKISAKQLQEIIWLRKTIEPIALGRAIELGDAAWEANILAARHRLERTTPSDEDSWSNKVNADWEYWHRRFHVAVLEGCGSPLLVQFCVSLHEATDRYRRTLVTLSGQGPINGKPGAVTVRKRARTHDQGRGVDAFQRDVRAEHRELSELALEHNAERARQVMILHIERTGDHLLKLLAETKEPGEKRRSRRAGPTGVAAASRGR
jgi:GntR family carbon starvation induced transcriptional regulator